MHRTIRNLITGATRCVLWPLYWLSHLAPRSESVWVFGGGFDAFSNGKHLALHVVRDEPSIDVRWITHTVSALPRIREAGVRAHYKWSLPGIWWSLRAGFVFVNSYAFDVNYWLTGGAVSVNLWHGMPLKHVGFDTTTGPLARVFQVRGVRGFFYRLLSSAYRRPDVMIATSEHTVELFSNAFRLPEHRCPPLGYPRNDVLHWGAELLERFIDECEPQQSRDLVHRLRAVSRVWAYVPTWRDSERDFIDQSGIDWHAVDSLCETTDALLIVKLHPLTKVDPARFDGLERIVLLDRRLDLYPVLPFVDALITDYSSIYFDFLHLDRPILFFPFDLEEYLADSRGMYFAYEEVTPGPKLPDVDGLYRALEEGPPAGWERERAALAERIWGEPDGRSAQRIVRFVREIDARGD